MTDDERIIEFKLSEVDELCAYEVKYDTEGLKHLTLIAIGEDADRRCESFIIKDYKCPVCGAYCHTTWTKGSSKEVVEVRE